MKVVSQWSPERDNLVWRVVSDKRGELLRPMVSHVYTLDEFALRLARKGAFTIAPVPGATVRVARLITIAAD